MGGKKWLVLALFVAAGPAWGQSDNEIKAAIGPQVDAYARCLNQHAYDFAKASTDADYVVVNKAISACEPERKALSEAAQNSSLGWSPAKADDQINEAVRAMRDGLLKTVKEARG